MNAVATKLQTRKATPARPAALPSLLARFARVDELLERVFDACEESSTIETLVQLVGHEMLPMILGPLRSDPTRAEAAVVYRELFKPLAMLEATVKMAAGTVLEGMLKEAFQELDTAHTGLDAVGEVVQSLPEVREVTREASAAGNVASAIAELLAKAEDNYSNCSQSELVSVHAHTLNQLAMTEVQLLAKGEREDESESLYTIAALIAGTRAYDMVDTPAAEDRQALLGQAYDLAESASISFGFVEEPCEALALGLQTGRQLGKTVIASALSPEKEDKRRELAFGANMQVQELTQAVIARLEDSNEDMQAEVGMLARICQLTEITFFAGRLYIGQDTDETLKAPPLESLERMFKGFMR
jgi:hypothetical protein